MEAGCAISAPGVADPADNLALGNMVAGSNIEFGSVGVAGFKPVAVIDNDGVAVCPVPAGEFHNTVAGGPELRPLSVADIQCSVAGGVILGDVARGKRPGKGGTAAREISRHLHLLDIAGVVLGNLSLARGGDLHFAVRDNYFFTHVNIVGHLDLIEFQNRFQVHLVFLGDGFQGFARSHYVFDAGGGQNF